MRRYAYAFVILLVAAVVAYSQSVYDSSVRARRHSDGAAPTFWKTGKTGTDSTTSTTAVNGAETVYGGDQLVKVDATTTISGATVQVEVWTSADGTTFDSIAGILTATTTAHRAGSGNYLAASPLFFYVPGAAYYDVRCTAVSSGTASLRAHTVGAGSFAAE